MKSKSYLSRKHGRSVEEGTDRKGFTIPKASSPSALTSERSWISSDQPEFRGRKKHTGDSDDGSNVGVDVPRRRAAVVVDVVPLPPLEGQCIQNSEEAHQTGPLGLVDCVEELKDELVVDVCVAANDF